MLGKLKRTNRPADWWEGNHAFPTEKDLMLLHQFTKSRSGWLYAINTPDHLGWGYKIGRTQDNPYNRARVLSHEGSPHQYALISAVFVLNAPWAEKLAHQNLNAFHFTKEWFKCDEEVAINTIISVQEKEKVLLGKYFDLSLLMRENRQDFIERGFYPEEMILNA